MSKRGNHRILFIQGHPDPESFCAAIESTYVDAARTAGHTIDTLRLHELDFNPNLKYGYRARTELEPDLLNAQEKIKAATHIVLLFPTWWGSTPALLKGFFDRVLLSRFGYHMIPGLLLPERLLKGRTAHVIQTMGAPWWYDFFIYRRSAYHSVKEAALEFCGIRVKRHTVFDHISKSTDISRAKILTKVKQLGTKGL